MTFAHQYAARNAITEDKLAYPAVLAALGSLEGKTGIDYGCGSAHFSRQLRNQGAHVIAADPDGYQILAAGKQGDLENIDLRVISANDFSWQKENSVDFVVANFVLCCMSTHSDLKNFVEESHRVLKKRGTLVICEPHPQAYDITFKSFKRDAPLEYIAGMPLLVHLRGVPDAITDYYWDHTDYKRPFRLDRWEIKPSIPRIAKEEKDQWPAEWKRPPFYLITATKR